MLAFGSTPLCGAARNENSLFACLLTQPCAHICFARVHRRSDTRVSYLTLFSPVGRSFFTHTQIPAEVIRQSFYSAVCVCVFVNINFSLLSNTHSPLAAESFAFDEFRRYCVWRTKNSKALLTEKSVCLLH
jgi:hypothetical protein